MAGVNIRYSEEYVGVLRVGVPVPEMPDLYSETPEPDLGRQSESNPEQDSSDKESESKIDSDSS
jgi:hypothetical protein